MALRRERVTRSGAGGKGDGGVVVDLDPLSAFALMGQRTEGASASPDAGTGSNNSDRGSAGATTSGGATTRSEVQPSRQQRPTAMGSWNAVELSIPAPSSRPVEAVETARETTGYPVANAGGLAHPITPSTRRPERRLSTMPTPSPPRQLGALGESSQLNSFKAVASSGRSPVFEDVPTPRSPEPTVVEKVDPFQMMKTEGIECLEGELLLVKLQNGSCAGLDGQMYGGVLIMTTYKLVVIPHRQPQIRTTVHWPGELRDTSADERYAPFEHLPKEYLQVPMTCIDKIERDSDRKGAQRADRYFSSEVIATIHCKDARRLRVSFGRNNESERAMKMLQQLAFPGLEMPNLFAFSHRTVDAGAPDPGWHIYDAVKEFDRMGVLKPRRGKIASPWRGTRLNAQYELCGSYPSVLVVPASVTDDEIWVVSQFRSEQRVPVLTWGRQADSASIWRCSQPKIGMSRAACAEDEHMLVSIAACAKDRTLPIVDCRPRSSATANFAAGYGYESYPACPLEFCGIGNIHVMRESLAKLENLCLSSTSKDQDWTSVVEDTRWLSHVRTVLSAAWTVAVKTHRRKAPVLVHCSHGWDRTSQVCSLAQMLLDPYYRTMDGFQVLIEKEWLAFGHPFHLRHAYGMQRGVTSGKEDQRSPIFLQFLDCTWQLVMQLPSYFEFNPRYLLCIADHIHTCRFGTFLCDTINARKQEKLEAKCASLWTFLELHRPTFVSQFYQSDTQEELLPPLSSILRHVKLWNDYFLRWSPTPSFMPLPPPIRDDSRAGGNNSSRGSAADGSIDGNKASPPKAASLLGGENQAEQGRNAAVPMFRCEYDEMDRWVALSALGADDPRRRAAFGDSGNSATKGSHSTRVEDLEAAKKEIAELKAALAEKEQLLNVMLQANTLEVGTPQRAGVSTPRAQTAPAKPSRDRRDIARSGGDGDDSITATSRTHGGSSLAEQAAAAAFAVAQLSSEDEEDSWAVSRPRGLSSTAESREVRRSSMSEINFDEDRGRCLTGAAPDLSYDGTGGGIGSVGVEHVLRNDDGQGSRTNSGWKWDFAAWHTGGNSKGGSGGVAKGKKRASKSSSKSL